MGLLLIKKRTNLQYRIFLINFQKKKPDCMAINKIWG